VRYLILSDIHSNWEALRTVLWDAQDEYEAILCCGDLVGYGPDPNRVVEWVRENVPTVIRGNHDRACAGMDDIEWFNPVAQAGTRWTIGELTPDNTDYLRRMHPGPAIVDDFMLVHGSPLDEDEYVANVHDAANVFPYIEAAITFFGHTHLQGGFQWAGEEPAAIPFPTVPSSELRFSLAGDGVWMVNPGSVGQPRDGDPRAAYALFDSESRDLRLRRVTYDTDLVCQRVIEAGLPPTLGTRLARGR
jgi:predicted phosphodiesterase